MTSDFHSSTMTPKFQESVVLDRIMSGSEQNLHGDRRWMEITSTCKARMVPSNHASTGRQNRRIMARDLASAERPGGRSWRPDGLAILSSHDGGRPRIC